ncbi:MAG: hypothetical protein HFJ49_04050, partial [Clostridia bacterium]|nr:hypothetical protein [Clostridia bacterium]
AKNMLSYRGTTLIILSIVIWIFEYLLAYLTLQLLFNMEFGLKIFTNYIDGAFMLFNTTYTNVFYLNIFIMVAIFAVILMALKFIKKGEKNER